MSEPLTLGTLRRMGLQFPRGTMFTVFVADDLKQQIEAGNILPNTVLVRQYGQLKARQDTEIGVCEMYRFVLEPTYDHGHWFANPDKETASSAADG